ncbi:MAG: glycosyltransferase family 4 protein [Deltaproteobacteria bacterium]|nr:glycosyltransferase family 4 protein [Candidatus Zymogenaceae bacterium]
MTTPEGRQTQLKVLHIITRMEEGGAPRVLLALLDGLDPETFIQEVATGKAPQAWDITGELKKRGVPYHTVSSMVRRPAPIQDTAALLSLWSLMRRGAYDIIHTHTSKGGFLGRLAAKAAGHARTIYAPHGTVFTGYFPAWQTRMFILAEKLAAGWCERIITLSHAEVREFLERGIGEEARFRVVPNGIDIEKLIAQRDREGVRAALGWSERDLVIVSVGRLEPVKGHLTLLTAAPRIIESVSGSPADAVVRFLIVGDGTMKERLALEAERLGISDRVHFTGHRYDAGALLSAGDLFAMPSLNEGMGLAVVEAMACGLPVAASRVGGIPEVVEDGVTGVLVPPNDADALAAACSGLLLDPAARERMGAEGERRARARYDIYTMIQNTAAVYRELMEGAS